MRKIAMIAAAGAALVAGGAQAATIGSLTGATSLVDLGASGVDKNLSNNGFYASGSSAVAYLFEEGANTAGTNATTTGLGIAGNTVESFLLHYDRQNGRGLLGGLTTGTASGGFTIQLGANQSFAGVAGYDGNFLDSLANANALRDTDFRTDVTYPNTSFTAALFRGTEGTLFGDRITLTSNAQTRQVTVNYRLSTTGSSLDEARFFVTTNSAAVPEPASWAMMIGGVGMIGGAMRRRSAKLAFA